MLVDRDFNLWKTGDGGKSWNQVYHLKKFAGIEIPPNKIRFSSPQNGIAQVTEEDIFETSDGGKNWKQVKVPSSANYAIFESLDDDNAWIFYGKNSNTMFVLRKEKTQWKQYAVSGASNFSDPEAIFFADKNTGWISTDMGELFATENGGKTWQKTTPKPLDMTIKTMFWLNSQTGWIGGGKKENQAVLLKTTDGGKSWKTSLSNNDGFFSDIKFTDQNNGWLVSRENIYKTNDGGETWKLSTKITLDCQ